MIIQSISSVLTGHTDVIRIDAYRYRIETRRKSFFSNRWETCFYFMEDVEGDSTPRLFARLVHPRGLHPKVLLGYHKNIVDYLNGLGEVHIGLSFDEAFEMMSICFNDYGDWQLAKTKE